MSGASPDPAAALPPELLARLLQLRHDLHRSPELSFQEHRTAERLERELEALGPADLRRVAGTGVVARLRGRDPTAPVVAIRGDIDALPIQEETGVEHASRVPGVMHACGHDVHAAWTVGAAHLLAAEPAHGDVVILLQPAEETGRGAEAVIAEGALDGVAAIFGGHVDLRFALGQVVAQSGPLAAATDEFTVELIGPGGHGARPHQTSDPVVGAAALVSALQTIVSRRVDPAAPAVVSVGTIHGGTAPNVIPQRVTLSGTLRTTDPDVRDLVHEEVRRLAQAAAAMHSLEARVEIQPGPPPVINAEPATAWAREAVVSTLGENALVPLGPLNLAGEDFAWYQQRIPGCFVRIGARGPGTEAVPAHTPRFYPADASVAVGAAVLAASARAASRALAAGEQIVGGGPGEREPGRPGS